MQRTTSEPATGKPPPRTQSVARWHASGKNNGHVDFEHTERGVDASCAGDDIVLQTNAESLRPQRPQRPQSAPHIGVRQRLGRMSPRLWPQPLQARATLGGTRNSPGPAKLLTSLEEKSQRVLDSLLGDSEKNESADTPTQDSGQLSQEFLRARACSQAIDHVLPRSPLHKETEMELKAKDRGLTVDQVFRRPREWRTVSTGIKYTSAFHGRAQPINDEMDAFLLQTEGACMRMHACTYACIMYASVCVCMYIRFDTCMLCVCVYAYLYDF